MKHEHMQQKTGTSRGTGQGHDTLSDRKLVPQLITFPHNLAINPALMNVHSFKLLHMTPKRREVVKYGRFLMQSAKQMQQQATRCRRKRCFEYANALCGIILGSGCEKRRRRTFFRLQIDANNCQRDVSYCYVLESGETRSKMHQRGRQRSVKRHELVVSRRRVLLTVYTRGGESTRVTSFSPVRVSIFSSLFLKQDQAEAESLRL
jgi:hypothetical protein